MPEFSKISTNCPIYPEDVLLLPDGGVLFVSVGPPMVFTVFRPDASGNYSNGSFSSVVSINLGQLGSGMSLGQNGRAYKFGGHTGNTGESSLIEYNPVTHTVREVPYTGALGQHLSQGIIEHPDGRIGRASSGAWNALNTSSGEPVMAQVSVSGLGGIEHGWTRLPDDSWVAFYNTGSSGNTPMDVLRLSANLVINNSQAGMTKPSSYSPTAWRYGSPQVLDWTNLGAPLREICAPIWMPKIGKVVMQGSTGAEIFSYDPATNTLAIPAHLTRRSDLMTATSFGNTGWSCPSGVSYSPGSLGTLDVTVTQTPAPYMTAGALTTTFFRIFTSNDGQWVSGTFTGSSRISGGSVGTGEVGDVIRLTGVQITRGSGTSIGKIDFGQDPVLGSYESWSGITPSGDYICRAGWGNIALVWDGTSSTAVDPWINLYPNVEDHLNLFSSHPQVWLPTGQLLQYGGGNNGGALWTPAATPRSDQKPVINSFPSSVRAGDTVTLSGNQLWGRHMGLNHGDDWSLKCNHPIVSLHRADGRVFFCPSKNWSTRSISPNVASTCAVQIPAAVPPGTYQMRVASAGNISEERTVKVGEALGGGISINQFGGFS